jgi:HD superfamily phosphohydrolase
MVSTSGGGPGHETNPYGHDERHRDRFKVQTIRGTGAVYLYGPELDVVDSPEFQRLQGIKQLGTSYFVFRGAVHTRFEHSLGTLQAADNIIERVNKNPKAERRVDPTGRRVARLAALLHDLPHVPFGHTLEDEFRLLKRHDKNQDRIRALLQDGELGATLKDALPQGEWDLLLRVMEAVEPTEEEKTVRDAEGKDAALVERLGEYAYIADIVANTVCADVLDYIVRDLTACGMPAAVGDRFLDFFVITPDNLPVKGNRSRMALKLDKRGMPRPDVESEIIKLLTYRYELAERVFFHHAKNAASVMIGDAVRLLRLHEDDRNFHWLSDDLLLKVLAEPKVGDALGLRFTEAPSARAAAQSVGELVERRRFYKLAFLGVADDDVSFQARDIHAKWGASHTARATLEEELAAKAGLPPGRVLVHLPEPEMMSKLAKVRVMLEGNTVITFEEWEERHSRRVQALNRAHQRLWRVAVYLHPEDAKDEGIFRLVGSAARDLFRLRSRYAEPEANEPYLATVFDLNAARKDWPAGEREAIIKRAAAAAASAEDPKTLDAAVDLLDAVASENGEKRVDRLETEGGGGQKTLPWTDAG